MASIIDRLHSTTAQPALLWLHGDDEGNVIRWAGGDPNTTVAVRGIFYPSETVRDEKTGVDFVTEDVLEVSGTLTTSADDKWEIDGAIYHVLAIGKVVAGIKPITLKRVEQKVRRSQRDII